MTATDFQVEIGAQGEQGYPVSVRAPDGAEAVTTMRLPPDAELRALLARIPDALLASSARVRRVPTDDEQPVRRLGRLLFDALLTGDSRALLVAARGRAAEQGRPLRMVLRVQSPRLAQLPWELLYDPGEEGYLCLAMPLVRYPQVTSPVRPLQVTPPLRVLCMISHSGGRELDIEQERQRLRTALAPLVATEQVELGFVPGRTWHDLRTALREPWHVFHFIGHGGFDIATQEGTLAIADEQGGSYQLGAEILATVLAGHSSMRLVVLNACETGRAAPADPFSSVAGALTRQATPAVVGMQYPISDPAAIEFSRSFYEALSYGQPVDAAVTEARQNIRVAIRDTLEWAIPVLHMRSPDSRLFEIPQPTTPPPPPADRLPPRPSSPAKPASPALTPRHLSSVDLPLPVRALHVSDSAVRLAMFITRVDLALADHRGRITATIREATKDGGRLARVTAVAFSPDGNRLATAGSDRFVRIWDTRTGEELQSMRHEQRPMAVAFSPDGNRLATGSYGRLARVWDIATGELRLEIVTERHLPAVVCVVGWLAFSPDGDLLAAGNQQGHIMIYNLTTGNPASRDFVAPSENVDPHGVRALAYHPHGTHLAVGTHTGYGYVWDTDTQECTMEFHDNKGWNKGLFGDLSIWGLAFNHDGTLLATGSHAKTVRVWDVARGKALLKVSQLKAQGQLAFTPDGSRLVITGGKQVQTWQLREDDS
jgi:hypothetical protein